MNGIVWVSLALLLALIVWAVVAYNRLVRARNMVSEAWSGMDVQLKRRHDLIPTLVESVKAYSSHESDLFEGIAQTRAQTIDTTAIPAKGEIEKQLSTQIRNLIAIAEAYPDLKASGNFVHLQQSLVQIEDDLQYARRYYNATVRDNNIRVQSFPSVLIASLCRFEPADYFELECATERQAPSAKFA